VTLAHSIFRGSAHRLLSIGGNSNNIDICNNLFIKEGGSTPFVIDGEIENIRIRNNILTTMPGDLMGRVILFGETRPPDYDSFVFDNNIYNLTSSSDSKIIYYDHGNYNFSQFQTIYGQETNGLTGNPLFIDPENENFHLQSTSPCINAGADLGLTQDFAGVSIPQGLAPDIGPYEYVSADVNGDGQVDALDVHACVNHILGVQDWRDMAGVNSADVNGDGSVDALDVQAIVNGILGNQFANQAPEVDPGTDQSITLPMDTVNLAGTVTDDGLPGTVIVMWSQMSGPGTVIFSNRGAVETTAQFSLEGTYILRLYADDGELNAYDKITITVKPDPSGGRLVAHWNLDESGDTTAYDSTGSGNNGALKNGPEWRSTEGRIDGALSFDGNDDYVLINDPALINKLSQYLDFTISGWIKLNEGAYTEPNGNNSLLYKAPNTIIIRPSGYYIGFNNRNMQGGTSSNIDKWVFVAITREGSMATYYRNGDFIEERNVGNYAVDLTRSRIGGRGSSYQFNGLIDDVRLYNYALSEPEIENLYNAGQ
jgi:hypothetical protein